MGARQDGGVLQGLRWPRRHPRHRHLYQRPSHSEKRSRTKNKGSNDSKSSKGIVLLGSSCSCVSRERQCERLAALARAVDDRSRGRVAAAVSVERDGERRVAGAARGRRRVVADRVRQSRLRHVAGGRWPAAVPAIIRRSTQGGDPATAGESTLCRDAHPRTDVAFIVEAFDRASGKRLWISRDWRRRASCRRCTTSTTWRAPARSPTASGSTRGSAPGQIVALDVNGKPVWSKHLGKEYGSFDINWGHASSPVLFEDSIILLCYHSPASYIARARQAHRRGEVEDRQARRGQESYSSPIVVQGPGGNELIVNSTPASSRSIRRRASRCGRIRK